MSRPPDPELETIILNAAQRLWKKGGTKSLTMRAVARAAETNTPAVYRRFRHREDILRGLLTRIRLEIAALLEGAVSPEEGCERYLDYALSHPHEYELYYQHEYELFYSPRSVRAGARPVTRPARDAMRRKLAEKLGGAPGDHEQLLLALWMLSHGTAMLLIAKTILPGEAAAARSVFTASVAMLLRSALEKAGK
ncbi:MAG TPA: TetR/AcrR family transcriptional regulator [Candidatus Aquilonibacter sp.]|nr:TetR/AcrR family transcriptional regulator [Candidatus Aquilonibacter sp.]